MPAIFNTWFQFQLVRLKRLCQPAESWSIFVSIPIGSIKTRIHLEGSGPIVSFNSNWFD